MPNEIITSRLEYLRIPVTFTGSNGTWKLIGIGQKDTFKNLDTGEYMDIDRRQVFVQAEKGNIK